MKANENEEGYWIKSNKDCGNKMGESREGKRGLECYHIIKIFKVVC